MGNNCGDCSEPKEYQINGVPKQNQQVHYNDREEFENEFKFEEGEEIGSSQNSQVRKCISKKDHQAYAVKIIVSRHTQGLDDALHSTVRTKNIEQFVKLHDAFAWESKFEGAIPFHVRALKLDVCETNLESFLQQQIKNNMQWDQEDILQIMQRLTKGLIELKHLGTSHGVINPNNILFNNILNENSTQEVRNHIAQVQKNHQEWEQYQTTDEFEKNFKLGAFLTDAAGLHQQYYRKENAIYMSPEQIDSYITGLAKVSDAEKTDVFSLGLLTLDDKMVAGLNKDQEKLQRLIHQVENSKMRQILTHCLEFDTQNRANLDQLSQLLKQ